MSTWYSKFNPFPKTDIQKLNFTTFDDVVSTVDFVLVYEFEQNQVLPMKLISFLESLTEVGLKLETDTVGKLKFVKIHAPENILYRYAELLKLKMPLKFVLSMNVPKPNIFKLARLNANIFPEKKYYMSYEFQRDKLYLYDQTHDNYFDNATKIIIISYILERQKYGDLSHQRGIEKLLSENVFIAAYPLHDGSLFEKCLRQSLLHEWGSLSKCLMIQPIDYIKDYFGVKIALYFGWLGFYTFMLLPASLAGIIAILYGTFTLESDQLSTEICASNITMCPLCDQHCPFWNLHEACVSSKISYMVDNTSIIYLAVFMSAWSATYLELWKRYSAELTHKWGMANFTLEAEPPRPEYLRKLADEPKRKVNFVTFISEPDVPFWTMKLPSIIFSFSIVMLWMLIVLMVVFGVVMYRMALMTTQYFNNPQVAYRKYLVPSTAAIINLIGILILGTLYKKLACKLTEFELHRTQTQFDESLSLKIYLFQGINYYSGCFYLAFLKGRFVGFPKHYNRILGYRQEECTLDGCLFELTLQLAIIMAGKQLITTVLEILVPISTIIYNKLAFKMPMTTEVASRNAKQWIEDYDLPEWNMFSLSDEYMEMIIQYGFVSLFVVAFPLAPLLAFFNNILELRLDARKMLKYYRRPVPKRVNNIGVWLQVMKIICRVSIITNAVIIAFASEFIPKFVYSMRYRMRNTFNISYMEFILSTFNTKHFSSNDKVNNPNNFKVCHYIGFRNPPNHYKAYERTVEFWIITTIRLLFIVVYQNMVGVMFNIIQWTIPDESKILRNFRIGEDYYIKERILSEERLRTKGNPNIERRYSSADIQFIGKRDGKSDRTSI